MSNRRVADTVKVILVLILLFSSISCRWQTHVDPPPISNPQAAQILANNCIYCHQIYSSYSDLDFIRQGLIVPGLPESSLLFVTLKGANMGAEETMPTSGQLNSQDIESLKSWISELDQARFQLTTFSKEEINIPGRSLSDQEIFSRCYGQWVRRRVPRNHKMMEMMTEGKINGVEACSMLLESAFLDSSGKSRSQEAREILKTFQAFHRSWFSELNFYNSDEQWGNFEIYDPGNLAAHVTFNLLDPQESFSNVFQGHQTYELIREYSVKRDFFVFPHQETSRKPLRIADFLFGSGAELKGERYPSWNIEPISTGEIIGVRKVPEGRDILPRMVNRRQGLKEHLGQEELHVHQDIRRGHGGGVLGDPMYLLLNLKKEIGEQSDGGVKVPRRWSTAVVQDFLCRSLPVIPLTRVEPFRRELSDHTFRHSRSCVQCHATMDGLAGVVRNFEFNYSVDSGLGNYIQTTHLRVHEPREGLDSGDLFGDGSTDFHLRPSKGKFVYKTVDGIFYQHEINSLEDLGQSLLRNPDLYRCLTKRYLHFLTGVDLSMETPVLETELDHFLYGLKQSLAQDFQRHQSLHQLIMQILNGPLFVHQLSL